MSIMLVMVCVCVCVCLCVCVSVSAESYRGGAPTVGASGRGAAAGSWVPPSAGEQAAEDAPVLPEPEPASRQVKLQIHINNTKTDVLLSAVTLFLGERIL